MPRSRVVTSPSTPLHSESDTEVPGLPAFMYAVSVGDLIGGAFTDGSIGTYNVATGEKKSFAFAPRSAPTATAVSRDGTEILVGFGDGHAAVYDVATGTTLKIVTVSTPLSEHPSIQGLAISDDHSRIYAAGRGLSVFDAATGQQLARNDDGYLASVVQYPPLA